MIPRNSVSTSRLKHCHSNLILLFPAPGNISSNIAAVYFNKSFRLSTSNIPPESTFGLLLVRTNFYAEAGGQEYDTGSVVIDGVAEFEVTNVQVFNGYILHIGRLKYGDLNVGDEVVASYDEVRMSHSR